MSAEKKVNEVVTRIGKTRTVLIKVRLHEITDDPERYRHRDPEDLKEASLESLSQSVTQEGLQVLPEVARDEDGRLVLIKGHRRIEVLRLLARKNTPGYTLDMEVEVLEVLDATPQDLLVRSISDNEVRKSLDREHRIRAAKKMFDAGVQNSRAARALGVSLKTYERDLILAKNPWMLQHVIDGSIEATYAILLLEEADRRERLAEFKEDIDLWIADRKREVRDREKLYREQHGKDLPASERQVKRFMPAHHVRHWLTLLREKRRFDEDAQWNFPAGIDAKSGVLRISSLTLDLGSAPLDQLAKVGSKLSQLAKQLAPHLKKRQVLDTIQGELAPEDAPYDFEYLQSHGFGDTADQLRASLQQIPEDPFMEVQEYSKQVEEEEARGPDESDEVGPDAPEGPSPEGGKA